MSHPEPSIDDLLAKARKGELRDLHVARTITTRDGTTHGYSVQTDGNSPEELAAAERQLAAERQALKETQEADRLRPIDVPEAMLAYQAQQAIEMQAFKAELARQRERDEAAEAAARSAKVSADAARSFVPDPENSLTKRWLEFVGLTGDIDWEAQRTENQNVAYFLEFREWWGRDDDLRVINRQLINRFITFLKTQRIVLAGARKGQAGLGGRTVDNHTFAINKFLKWAQDKGYFPEDKKLPTEGQAVVKKKARKKLARKANPPYTPAQLRAIFDPKIYDAKLAHHWWPPLLALFTGARRGEIAQLLLDDIEMIEGIPALTITDLGDEDKHVKSEAARRTIPIHPELVTLGFLDYVEDVRSLDIGPYLFPGIAANAYGEKGNAVGTAWGRHLQKCGLSEGSSPTFHSFRATAIELLKKSSVDFDMRCQMVGHESGHVGEDYTG